MLISFFFPKMDYRFFFDYQIWESLSRYAVGYCVTCHAPLRVATSAVGLVCRSL